jgi:hypothetical protein
MKMCVCHYSIFCDIVIAQLELNDITELAQTQQSLEHWRHFEHFYIRLRSIQDRFERMWDFAGDFCAPGSSILPPFDQYKKDNDDDKIIQQYNDWSNEVRAIANNIIHFGRLGSKIFDNQFLLPKNLASLKDADKDIPWYSYAAVHPNDFVPTVTKMEEHFNATFSWLDPLERRLEGLLKQAMAKSAIKINYDDVIPAAPPSDGIILCRGSSATSGASAYEDPLDQSCQSQCETGSESGTEELEQDGQ